MYRLFYDVTEDVRKLGCYRARGFRKILKQSLFRFLREWHSDYAADHFSPAAYSKYPMEYPARYRAYKDRRQEEPLQVTGTLRGRIVGGKHKVSGTSKAARMTMQYGRPPVRDSSMAAVKGYLNQAGGDYYKAKIFQLMRSERISYKQAARRVFKSEGYNEKTKRRFEERIPVIHGSEAQRMYRSQRGYIVGEMNTPGPKRTRRING